MTGMKPASTSTPAPCTANVMAKAAHGIADDLFSTTLLATTAPIVVAPAMNVHMYEKAATQTNMETLKTRGFHFVEADDGYLACGDVGRGRLAEPERIVSAVLDPPTDSTMAFCPGSSSLRSICLNPLRLSYRAMLDIRNDSPLNKAAG